MNNNSKIDWFELFPIMIWSFCEFFFTLDCNVQFFFGIDCCSAVTCMTINLQVFPGLDLSDILDARAVHWWACVQMLDAGVWFGKCSKLPDNATRTICRYMYLSCRVWLSHVCFFIVKCLTLFFRVYSEWQWILSGVLSLNPSLKRTNFRKNDKTKQKRGKKKWITF